MIQNEKRPITDQLDIESIRESTKPTLEMKKVLKHPITKVVIGGVVIYGLLFVSKYFINGYAELVKASRNLKGIHRR